MEEGKQMSARPEVTGKAFEAIDPLAVTVNRAAELSGLGVSTVWALIKDGKLESTSVGRRRLVIFTSIKRLLGQAA